MAFPISPPSPSSSQSRGGLSGFFKDHPIVFLLLLTPGIPEYLSASSQLTVILINPFVFFLFLAANLGLYGSGALLIREAMVRWKKGWASVFLLGAAYGILEEGIDLWTLFYSKAGPVGNLGYYGHWLGVNWVWTMGLVIFHSVFSIGIPIFLFGLVFPELKSKSLVKSWKLTTTFVVLILDSIFLYVFVSTIYSPYSPGGALILSSGIAITILVFAAKRLPSNFLKARTGPPGWSPFKFAFVGALLFPATLFAGALSASANIPPAVPLVLDLVLAMLILTGVYKLIGTEQNQKQKVALGIGLLFPIASFGIIASIGLFNILIVVADLFYITLARRLWRKWRLWTILQRRLTPALPASEGSLDPFLHR